jgi:hypothetical protein
MTLVLLTVDDHGLCVMQGMLSEHRRFSGVVVETILWRLNGSRASQPARPAASETITIRNDYLQPWLHVGMPSRSALVGSASASGRPEIKQRDGGPTALPQQ